MGDILLKYEGWRELHDARERDSWERARSIAYWSAAPNLKPGANFNNLFKNPYEKRRDYKPISREEFEKRLKRWDDLKFKKLGKSEAQVRLNM